MNGDWLFGVGYIRLWERVHRAEEALIMTAPIERVIAGALEDELRLRGSSIDNRDQLIALARAAVTELIAQRGLRLPVPVPPGETLPVPPTRPVGVHTAADEQFARAILRRVRSAINEFRDDSRLGLVRARNQLLRTVLGTAVVSYLMLALAIGVGAPPHTITAAASFFLVGAAIGLFNRLYLDASAQSAVEDFGLSTARLLHTPIFSGIAAVGGVLLIPMLAVLIGPGLTGAGSATPADGTTSIVAPSLVEIFNIATRPFGLVIAAIFGLTPATLISRLQQEAEQFKSALKNTEAPARQ